MPGARSLSASLFPSWSDKPRHSLGWKRRWNKQTNRFHGEELIRCPSSPLPPPPSCCFFFQTSLGLWDGGSEEERVTDLSVRRRMNSVVLEGLGRSPSAAAVELWPPLRTLEIPLSPSPTASAHRFHEGGGGSNTCVLTALCWVELVKMGGGGVQQCMSRADIYSGSLEDEPRHFTAWPPPPPIPQQPHPIHLIVTPPPTHYMGGGRGGILLPPGLSQPQRFSKRRSGKQLLRCPWC